MTRTERLKKLSNAVKEYRGSYDPKTKKWIRPPNPSKRRNIIRWLTALSRTRVQMEADAAAIDGFKTLSEFHAWLAEV